MSSNATKAATGGDGRDLREVLSGQECTPEIAQVATWPQERLVATASNSDRRRYEIWLWTYSDGQRRVVLTRREKNGRGEWRATGPTLTFAPGMIDAVSTLLKKVEAAAFEEGLLS